MMVTRVVKKKAMSCAGLRSIWKTKKYLILEKHVKTTNFKQNLILRSYKEQKYIKLIVALTSFNTYSRKSLIFQVCKDLPFSIISEDGKIPSTGNVWCITSIGEIYLMGMHDLFMFICVRLYIMHGRRGPTRCNVSRRDSTWCLAQSLLSAWQTFVEFISLQQFSWFW